MHKFDHQLRVLEIKNLLTCRHTHVLTNTNILNTQKQTPTHVQRDRRDQLLSLCEISSKSAQPFRL